MLNQPSCCAELKPLHKFPSHCPVLSCNSRTVVIATPTPPSNVIAKSGDENPACSCCSSRLPEPHDSPVILFPQSPSQDPLDLTPKSSIHRFFKTIKRPQFSSPHDSSGCTYSMSWLFLDWFVPVYLLVSVLVLAGFGACLYCLEPGLQDAHKWSNKTVRHHPLVASVNCTDEDTNALI
ncbi:unnamed protein product [Arctogadus glacialis]